MCEEIVLKANESRDIVWVNEPNVHVRIIQEEGSQLRLHIIDWQSADNDIQVEQVASNCVTELYQVAYLKGNQKVTTHTNVRHIVGGGTSKQVLRFVLSEHAKGEFLGTLYIAKDAQKSCAEQSNRNLLLDDTATMRTRPQLEIYADDVQAAHGATTGQLDENALFYMQQRGISRLTAKQMLIVAFLSEAIETIRDEEQKERLLNTIDRIL